MSAYSPDKLSQPPAGLINIASLRWFPSIKCLAAEDRPAGFQLQGKVAYLHASRELDFILGVQQSECCQLYCKDSSHSGPKVPDSRVLWCNFGPEDHRHLGSESNSAAANDAAIDAFPHIENSSVSSRQISARICNADSCFGELHGCIQSFDRLIQAGQCLVTGRKLIIMEDRGRLADKRFTFKRRLRYPFIMTCHTHNRMKTSAPQTALHSSHWLSMHSLTGYVEEATNTETPQLEEHDARWHDIQGTLRLQIRTGRFWSEEVC